MADFYTYGDSLTPHTRARSNDVITEFRAVETAMAKLPALAEIKEGRITDGTDAGAANVYVVTTSRSHIAYADLMEVWFQAANGNTDASTIDVDGVGAVAIKRQDGTALQSGDIPAAGIIGLRYDNANSHFKLITPAADAAAAAASASAAASSASSASSSASSASSSASAAASSASDASDASDSAAAAAASAAAVDLPDPIVADRILIGNAGGTAWEQRTSAQIRTQLGLVVGTDVQAQAAVLDDLSTLGVVGADGEFLVGTGAGALAWESGATVRASLGLTIGTDVLAPNGDGSSLTGIADQIARDNTIVLGFKLSEGDGLSRFAMVNTVVDQFEDTSGIDAATSTNETYDASGDYYHNPATTSAIAQGTGSAIGDMTAGGGLAAAFDSDTTQALSACATKSSATDAYVGKDYSAAPKRIAKAVAHSSNNTGYLNTVIPTVTIRLYGKNGSAPASSSDGTLLGTVSFTDTADESAGRDITSSDTSTQWDYVWCRVTHDGAANDMYVAEIVFHEVIQPPDMTLVPNAITAASAPDEIRVVIDHEAVDSTTIGTDFTMEASRDGGTTYSTATLSEVVDNGSGRTVQAGTVDVSGQPSGTSVLWRAKTLNGKEQRVHAVGVQADQELSVP